MADLGHLFKDTESFVLAWGTDGLWFTTAEAIGFTNTTIANTTSSATTGSYSACGPGLVGPVTVAVGRAAAERRLSRWILYLGARARSSTGGASPSRDRDRSLQAAFGLAARNAGALWN